MPAQQGGRGRGKNKSTNPGVNSSSKNVGESPALIDTLMEACPPQKLGDLEALVKNLNGDEAKIRQTIAEWWEEPATPNTTDEEWNDVGKTKGKSKPAAVLRGGGGSAAAAAAAAGIRGGGRNGGGRGRGGRGGERKRSYKQKQPLTGAATNSTDEAISATTYEPPPAVEDVPDTTIAVVESTPQQQEQPPEPVNVVPQPSPSPVVPTSSVPTIAAKDLTPQRNVWTTKGSAHLIHAEKPQKPTPPTPIAPRANNGKQAPSSKKEPPQETPIPLSIPEEKQDVLIVPPEPAILDAEVVVSKPSIPKPTVPVEPSAPASAPAWVVQPPPSKPTRSVNMGRWDLNDSGDQDFEFGSFQEDVTEPAVVEIARPPPGLSMPPMPANAVLVHELENTLEQHVSVSNTPQIPPVYTDTSAYATSAATVNIRGTAGYGTTYPGNGYSNTSGFSTKPGTAYSATASTAGTTPSEVLQVPPQNHYGAPMYYQPHQMHLAGQHQTPYSFAGYTQLQGYAFAPNGYNYNAGGGGQEDTKNNRNRNSQSYQQYAQAAAYMSNHAYDPRYEHGYVPPQQQPQASHQQSSYNATAFDTDYSKKSKGGRGGGGSTNLHNQFHGGPPTFLQQQQQEHAHPQQHQPEWHTTGWSANTWQSGGGK